MNARVLIDGASELVFDYAIPAGLNVQPGCRVRIPLRRKSATGTVLSMGEAVHADFALRELESLIDPEPLITPVLLRAADWIAHYYGSSIESVIRAVLPEGVRSEENSAKTRRVAVLDAAPEPEVMAKLALAGGGTRRGQRRLAQGDGKGGLAAVGHRGSAARSGW